MRRARYGWVWIALAMGLGCVAVGQTAAPMHKPVSWKRHCQPDNGFCFKYPSSWTMLGEVFGGNGVVVAPAQKDDRAGWDEITAALVAPAPEGDQEPLGLNGVIEQAATAMRNAGQNFQTLQRARRTVDHKPAQMLKAKYHEQAGDRDWIEELVFIEGPDNEIYSVALKCAPQNAARLELVLSGVLGNWTLPEAPPPATESDGSAAGQFHPTSKKPPPDALAH